jgi:hypothetical protein
MSKAAKKKTPTSRKPIKITKEPVPCGCGYNENMPGSEHHPNCAAVKKVKKPRRKKS